MPHSSGGGSHGGGFHGGSSSSGSSMHSSSTAFEGATRYIYYKNGQPVEVYANYDITKDTTAIGIAMTVFFCGVFVFLSLIFTFTLGMHHPKKLKTDYDTKIVIMDNANVLSGAEEIRLRRVLGDFRDETGITPAIVTVNDEDWEDDHSSLEDYSYYLYLYLFEDEKHWLIVYSQPEKPDEDFNDWQWEGMQGDDTDSILSSKETSRFTERLHKDFLKSDVMTLGEAFEDAFEDLTPHAMDRYEDWTVIIISWTVAVGVSVLFIVLMVKEGKKDKELLGAFKCTEETVRQEKCDYCGGVYIAGHHTNCPYCQAAIPPEFAEFKEA